MVLRTSSRKITSISRPSILDTGFSLSLPPLPNPVTSDPAFQRILSWYLPDETRSSIAPSLQAFGQEAVSPQIYEWISNAEREVPYVKTRNVWTGKYAYDRLITSTSWKELGRWGIRNGVVARGYDEKFGPHRRIVQHAFNFVYSASSAVYSCPVSMTSGAARLMAHQLPRTPSDHPFHEVYKKIVATEDNWISSQWMTERPGGSDVQNSETVALYSPSADLKHAHRSSRDLENGDWLISGFKFFCSATDCNIALMLAKTESGKLSLFLAPTRRSVELPDGTREEVTNGIRFHRLKNKMGTKELPTAELELESVRAHLVGPVDRGIATIATLLNVTRTHNFITALSCWRRGMAIAKNFARVRTTIDQPLWTFPMHLRLLANMEIKFAGLLQLAFFTTSLLSFADNGFPYPRPAKYAPLPEPGRQTKVVQRILTATGKAVICKVACTSLQECQEAMGGVGYMDEPDEPEHNISRLYRDTAANMTWEGTTNVLASEVTRHILDADNLDIFSSWLEDIVIEGVEDVGLREPLQAAWAELKHKLTSHRTDIAMALVDGRQHMFSLAWIVSGALLAHDAQRDNNAMGTEIAKRWILHADGGVGEYVHLDVLHAAQQARSTTSAKPDMERTKWDCRIVWGEELPTNSATGYRAAQVTSGRPEQVLAHS
ncbi:hypothetical protein LTR86_004245 [Recurvomyces mirabilis]|nr:hypothetical protein LTR86_004245 [Recurvomyces mirabilis]